MVRLFAVQPWEVAIWFVGAAILHDLILLPCTRWPTCRPSPYSVTVPPTARRCHGSTICASPPSCQVCSCWSGSPYLPPRGPYPGDTGLSDSVYLGRWLAITGVLFAASAVAFALRLRRVLLAARADEERPPPDRDGPRDDRGEQTRTPGPLRTGPADRRRAGVPTAGGRTVDLVAGAPLVRTAHEGRRNPAGALRRPRSGRRLRTGPAVQGTPAPEHLRRRYRRCPAGGRLHYRSRWDGTVPVGVRPLPGEGAWQTLLLADGNIGIGGDPGPCSDGVRSSSHRRVSCSSRSSRSTWQSAVPHGWKTPMAIGVHRFPGHVWALRRSAASRQNSASASPTSGGAITGASLRSALSALPGASQLMGTGDRVARTSVGLR